MIEQALTVIIILVVCGVYFCWIKPKRLIKRYVKQLKQLGYSVIETPYNPLKYDMFETFRKGIKEGDALKYYKDIRSKYDVHVGNVFTKPRIELYHPDFHRQFFGVDKHYQYPKAQRIIDIFCRIGGKGLVFSEGKEWHRKRKVLNSVFNFDFIKSQTNKVAKICQNSLKKLEQAGEKIEQKNFIRYSLSNLTVDIFSCVMMEIFLGGSSNQTINGQPAGNFVAKIMSDIHIQAINPINALLGPNFTKLGVTKSQRDILRDIREFNEWGLAFIRNRINQIKSDMEKNKNQAPSDIIEALIMAKYEGSSQQTMSTQAEILQQFVIFFVAGTDTTSSFTEMMIYLIALHPQVQAKVRAEIDTFMKTEDYSYQNLKNLVYIESVQKQVTRFYGPGINMFSRVAKQDNHLNGLFIKKDTNIALFFIPSHYNEKYFKNPKQFRPERWSEECKELPNFVFGGFGGGARTCIGKHLAMLESKIALVKFMKRYKEIKLPKKQIKMVYKLLYSPENFKTDLVLNDEK